MTNNDFRNILHVFVSGVAYMISLFGIALMFLCFFGMLSGCSAAKETVSETTSTDTTQIAVHNKFVKDSVSERQFDRTSDSVVEKVHEIIELDSAGKVISHKIDRIHETYQAHGKSISTSRDSTGKQSLAKIDTVRVNHTDTITKPVYLAKNEPTKVVAEKAIPKVYKVAMWFMVIVILGLVVFAVIKFKLYDKIKKIKL